MVSDATSASRQRDRADDISERRCVSTDEHERECDGSGKQQAERVRLESDTKRAEKIRSERRQVAQGLSNGVGSRCRSLGMMQIQLLSDARGAGCNDVCHCGVTINNRAHIEVYLIKMLFNIIKLGRWPRPRRLDSRCLPLPPFWSNTRPIQPQRSAKD